MFFNNLKRKISTGHIGKQDTFDPPPPLPLRNMSKNSFVLVGLPFPIFKRPVVFICCRTVSLHQAGDLTCWIAIFQIFQIWGGKWLKCRQCSLFSDKGLATTGLRNNVWGGRRASQVTHMLPGEMNISQLQGKIEFNTFFFWKPFNWYIKLLNIILVVLLVGWWVLPVVLVILVIFGDLLVIFDGF